MTAPLRPTSPAPQPCYWWNRWLHRRLREADQRFMVPLLMGQIDEDDRDRRIAAFALFTSQPGQEHWHCECGMPAARTLVEML